MKRKLLAGLTALVVIVAGAVLFRGDTSAASLSTKAYVNLNAILTNTSGPFTASAPLDLKNTIELANGVAANQANKIFAETAAIATAGTQSYDLAGAMVDVFGAAFTPAKLKCIYIESCGATNVARGCLAANTTNLTLLGDAASVPILNTVATTTTLPPGGVFFVCRPDLAGWAVTGGTGDIVKIVNAAGATAYVQVVLVGTSS